MAEKRVKKKLFEFHSKSIPEGREFESDSRYLNSPSLGHSVRFSCRCTLQKEKGKITINGKKEVPSESGSGDIIKFLFIYSTNLS